jgi:hypothetical protein
LRILRAHYTPYFLTIAQEQQSRPLFDAVGAAQWPTRPVFNQMARDIRARRHDGLDQRLGVLAMAAPIGSKLQQDQARQAVGG